MTYYEELGLSPSATSDEIKDAYRALIRLLHPDQHPDPNLQRVAERQVQKLNRIYEILSDPERRRTYDRDLMESAERAQPIIIHAPPPPRRSFNKSSLAWISAAVAFLVLMLWMASRPVQTQPTYSSGASIVENPAVDRVTEKPVPMPTTPEPRAMPTRSKSDENVETEALRARLAQALNERDRAIGERERLIGERDAARNEVGRLETRLEMDAKLVDRASQRAIAAELRAASAHMADRKPAPNETRAEIRTAEAKSSDARINEARLPAASPTLTAKVSAPPPPPEIAPNIHNPLAGNWVYKKPVEASKNKDLIPPEFIETTITEENGQFRGTYRARYRVPNRPVSPDVNFQFAGRLSGESGSLPWSGAGGSKGEVSFKLMADHSLRVDWTASQLGSLGFYKGTAVLVKRSD